ncbi:MAG: Carbamate kinase [Streptosporangiaceae bacterium]|nr:Carbamate kinase [Streptosporangiaceae bacterium]
MRVVIALGEDALLGRGQRPDVDVQQDNITRAVRALAPLADRHELLITHGNAPQIGVLAVQSANDLGLSKPYPLDTLGAQTQGMIGYWILQALQNALPGRQIAAMITQTLVSAFDPAFEAPATFVGPVYEQVEAEKLAQENGWTVKRDGQYWRRVVPSPRPQRVIETRLLRRLLRTGTVLVCAGGGGVPVVRNGHGRLEGVEVVLDEYLTGATLAETLGADAFLILTDASRLMRGSGTPGQEEIGHTTPYRLRAQHVPAGPVEAVCGFVERTGGMAAIGLLDECEHVLAGTAGTIVTPNATWPLASTL